MMVSSVGSDPYSMRQMAPVGNRQDPSEMFNNIDEDEDGSLSEEEAGTIADMISNATGEEVTAADLIDEYDEDGDGALSEEETEAALEANRPEGPPPGGMMARGDFDASQMFNDADEDEDGSLDETEAETIAEMISNATGEEVTAESLIEAYDEDGDGVLSEEETQAVLEANRPEGPPPPPEMEEGSQQNISWQAAAGIENYMTMANLDMDQDQSLAFSAMFGGNSAYSSSGTLMSVNTRV